IFLFAIPNLSQDFFRFIWDGRMIFEGFNPYLYTPESFITQGSFPVNQAQELYNGMGELNGSHFTNYPPINQLCFLIAAIISGTSFLGSVMVFRIIIILADLGILVFGSRLLELFRLPKERIFWYVLNPFIIIELTGNLHFESVMIFFLIWSLYLLFKGRWQWAAALFSLSISVKLIPLLFLPLFFKFFKKEHSNKINFKRLISFYMIIGLVTLALFLPFFNSQFVTNYSETVALWFNNFEFNGSIYYVLRDIGFLFRGYNEIAIIGKVLAILVFLMVIGLSIFKNIDNSRVLIERMLIAFAIYLFLSTTVHPWYLSTLLALSLFTTYRFPFIWTFVIILSYLAYVNINSADKSENLWVITLEYAIVFSVIIWEILFKKPKLIKGN
ncbi:MAG: DUF2029 domain-containing protein, partial [Psychroserpens sp.]|nr:DUF2029 domain-containing protein [Psychroserpens sp.]